MSVTTVYIILLAVAIYQGGNSQYQCDRVLSTDDCYPNTTTHILPARNSFYQYPQKLPEYVNGLIATGNVAIVFATIDGSGGDPECGEAMKYVACIVSNPPCNVDSGLLLPICHESCLAFTRVLEEGRCESLFQFGRNVLHSLMAPGSSQLTRAILTLLLEFNCNNMSTYSFYNATGDPQHCTDLYTREQEEEILSRPNQCTTTTTSICDGTNHSPHNAHVPLQSRNTTGLLQTLNYLTSSTDENCKAALTFLSCSYIFPPCNPDSGVALPMCTDVCENVTGLIKPCLNSTAESELTETLLDINCSNPRSYIPLFVHIDDNECVNGKESGQTHVENTTTESDLDRSVHVGIPVGVTTALVLAALITIATVIVIVTLRKRRSRNHKHFLDRWMKDRASHKSSIKYLEDHKQTSVKNEQVISEEDRKNYKKIFASILVPYASLTIGDEIGHGAFGMVYHGHLSRPSYQLGSEIAIKTIRNLSSKDEMSAFFAESLLMKDFEHPNILGLTGVCFDTPDGVPYILLPFMTNGSLKDYLKKKRTHVTNVDTLPEDMKVATLVRICMDVANGMEYLATKKFVHRDLAARNCLVDEQHTVKVADFGLARDVYSSDYYRARQGAKVAVKWMAPETLHDGISNEKTDVWSYGVTCWEVFSLGRAPYPGMQNADILDLVVTKQKRLERPTLCTTKLYNVAMFQCWSLVPEERPPFSQLVLQLQEYWDEEHAYVIDD